MQKIRYIITSFLILFIVTGCSSVGFSELPISNKTATVYAYVEMPQNIDERVSDSCYKIAINNELLKSCMKSEEFMAFRDLKPQTITISAIRDDIDKKSIELTLNAGETYFLKIQSYSQIMGQFDFKKVKHNLALESITNMKMANPPKREDDGMLDFFVSKDRSEKTSNTVVKENVTTASKMQEIKEASEMRDKGIITQKEFDTLKTEILNAN